jgi:uncharacterized protein (DUF2384 family)
MRLRSFDWPGIVWMLVYDEVMGSPIYPSEAEQLSAVLKHPNASAVWSRALETFGDETKARHWMSAPRDIFEGRSPQELVNTGDPAKQRRVLTVLIRIDYGVFSLPGQ